MPTITLTLSEPIYQTAFQVSKATGQSLETVLQNSISQTLPPLDDVSAEEAHELAKLALLDDAKLWHEANATMTPTHQEILHTLLDKQSEGPISTADETQLETLLDTYGRLTVRKAHAWLLLARRGYRVPMQQVQD